MDTNVGGSISMSRSQSAFRHVHLLQNTRKWFLRLVFVMGRTLNPRTDGKCVEGLLPRESLIYNLGRTGLYATKNPISTRANKRHGPQPVRYTYIEQTVHGLPER